MIFNYSVSFEHDTKPVMTHKGQIEAKEPSEASRKAIVRAEKALKLRVWRSVVAVLEKLDEPTEQTS